jgi:hypothetical protein
MEVSNVMKSLSRMLFLFGGIVAIGTVALSAITTASPTDPSGATVVSARFSGPKANTGTVSYAKEGMKHVLTLSADFKVPDTPDPHWMLVDSKGTTYLLDKLTLKGDRVQRTIAVPGYIGDVQKVVIWCAWAEVNLGEAGFESTVKTR